MVNKNNFSYWFKEIEKVSDKRIKIPKSLVFSVPKDIQECFYECNDVSTNKIGNWLESNVLPVIKKEIGTPFFFVKNARFSNKFDGSCFSYTTNLLHNVININYGALCLGAGGTEELVIREWVGCDYSKVSKIYNGLPLRPEFRVFYDFDTKEVLYSANYWDPKYVEGRLWDKTDKVVFASEKEYLKNVYEMFFIKVEEFVADFMKDVNLEGKWSVDVLRDGCGDYWLIDMALAEESAYWRG